MNRDRLLQRFLRYVQIDSTAGPDVATYPSSAGQMELGRLLLGELKAMGIADARQNQHGIVMATVPGSKGGKGDSPHLCEAPSGPSRQMGAVPFSGPTVALCSHLDTSPETSGTGIRPQVIENYPGGDIVLPGDPSRVIRVADNHGMESLRGRTLITSDGTTLLGADDKAGVAIIMETAAWLLEHFEIAHCPLRICFTCDEETGHGVDKLDLKEIDAAACYTLDGHGSSEIDVETFSADQAVVSIHGVNIHPSIGKGKMVNAVRVAADFVARLPRQNLSPETTDERDGFFHPYDLAGGVGEMKLKILLRDFDASKLAGLADRVRQAAAASMREFPGSKIDVAIERQYRNMAEGLIREPRAVAFAEEALKRLGRTGKRTIVRGGTDGSRLTELGLPTPNLSCGGHNPHSPLEWACLDEMVESVEWLVKLAEVWGEDKG
ncbi:MAG: peptidase T [Thermoguttaceae bacterium]|jgi:tripeptide aminopeptidase